MATRRTAGKTTLERIRARYEDTDKKCTACGFVDEAGNWTSRMDDRRLVYRHVCPSCGASREHTFDLAR